MNLSQKLPRNLGSTKLKIGISVNELLALSFLPMLGNFFDFEAFVSLVIFAGGVVVLSLKNLLLAPRYISHGIQKQSHMEWKRISID